MVEQIEDAIGKHTRWMSALQQVVFDARAAMDVESIRAADQCEFGKWLCASFWLPEDRATDQYQEVRKVHAEFHALAGQIVELAASGKAVEAYSLLFGEYITLSGQLALTLREWQKALCSTR